MKARTAVPDTLMILGTDASGKDYVGKFIADMILARGHKLEIRKGWLSRKASMQGSSEKKSRFELLREHLFIRAFGFSRFFLPPLISFLIREDVKRFSPGKDKTLIISNTPIRILAFYLGHLFKNEKDIRLPAYLDSVLKKIVPATGVKTIVLDIEDHVRRARIMRRQKLGRVDYFDRYMAQDSLRSEKIEDIVIRLAVSYLDAFKLDNNDLNDRELADILNRAFYRFSSR